MPYALNKVELIGNIGKEPEIRTMQSGERVATFSVATKEKWKDRQSGEPREVTEWHNVVIYNKGLITVVEKFLNKGSKIFVEGKIQTRKYPHKKYSDVEMKVTEIVLQAFSGNVILLDGAKGQGTDQQDDTAFDSYHSE